MLTAVHSAGELVWEETSTFLRRGRGDGQRAGGLDLPGRPADRHRVAAARATSAGRYAAVSGDHNPIHLYPLTAKALGFPRQIAHGMWSKARCVAALENRLPDAVEVDVAFKKPILLPGSVAFGSRPLAGHDGLRVLADQPEVRRAAPRRPHPRRATRGVRSRGVVGTGISAAPAPPPGRDQDRPSRVKTRASDSPRAAASADGETWSKSHHSSARNGRWNQSVWSSEAIWTLRGVDRVRRQRRAQQAHVARVGEGGEVHAPGRRASRSLTRIHTRDREGWAGSSGSPCRDVPMWRASSEAHSRASASASGAPPVRIRPIMSIPSSGPGTSGIASSWSKPSSARWKLAVQVVDRPPVLTRHHPTGGERAAVPDPLDVVDDRHLRVAGQQEVGVQRVRGVRRVDGADRRRSGPGRPPGRRRPAAGRCRPVDRGRGRRRAPRGRAARRGRGQRWARAVPSRSSARPVGRGGGSGPPGRRSRRGCRPG